MATLVVEEVSPWTSRASGCVGRVAGIEGNDGIVVDDSGEVFLGWLMSFRNAPS